MNTKKILATAATAVTSLVTYELAVIGTRALAEDASFVKANLELLGNKKSKKRSGRKGRRK